MVDEKKWDVYISEYTIRSVYAANPARNATIASEGLISELLKVFVSPFFVDPIVKPSGTKNTGVASKKTNAAMLHTST